MANLGRNRAARMRSRVWLFEIVNRILRAGGALNLCPLAREVDALVERGGWGKSAHTTSGVCGGTPTPALPRKREREEAKTADLSIRRW